MVLSHHAVIVQAIELIESRIGMAVGKQYQQEFANMFSHLASGNPLLYLAQLRELDEQSVEWQRLINTMTVGETYFLREQQHFDLLRRHILPKLILQRRQSENYSLRIWSAGCASGEEPYSIAMFLHQFLPDIGRWHIDIYGTDINEFALQNARNGVYRQWAFRHTDAIIHQQYFDAVNTMWQIKPFIRNMVTFRRHNMLHDMLLGSFDIIFCRNVLLYFEDTKVAQAESRLYEALNAGGWLFLGQAEALRHQRDRWQTHTFPATTIYQRPSDAPVVAIDHQNNGHALSLIPINPANHEDEENHYEQAVSAIHADDYRRAEHFLSLALSDKHNLAKSHTLLAWLFANRKAIPEAHSHITAALALDPLLADIHYVNALLSIESNKIDEAIRSLQMTLYCDRDHALAAFMLGNLFAQTGNLPKAYNQWQQVGRSLEAYPDDKPISDFSDMTAGRLKAMITDMLDEGI